jgi:hypothetical protein
VVIVEHGERIRQNKKVRPSEESGGNDDNHQRVRKKKNEGAWIRLDNEQGEGDIDIFSSKSNSFIEGGVAWKVL